MRRQRVALFLILLGSSICLTSCNDHPKVKTNGEDGQVSINLNAVTHSNQAQMFTEVRQVSLLPRAVLDHFGHGIADPGQDFNKTDVQDIHDPKPSHQLLVAAVSKQHCIVSYVTGGIRIRFEMTIFDLSNGSARVIFQGAGGDTSIRGLKATVETAQMRNELAIRIDSPASGTVVHPGQTITVEVSSPSGVVPGGVFVLGEEGIHADEPSGSLPARISVSIPTEITPRRHSMTAIAAIPPGQAFFSIELDVEMPDSPAGPTVEKITAG
jgi:hypothetical protein